MRTTYSPRALRQLEAIHAYITEHSPLGAAAVITRIRERCEMVGELPGMGTATDQAGVRVLRVTRYPYLIFYAIREASDEVRILRVRHGARQPEELSADEISS